MDHQSTNTWIKARMFFLGLAPILSGAVLLAVVLTGLQWASSSAERDKTLPALIPFPATPADFHLPGSQPGTMNEPFYSVYECARCHANYGQPEAEPFFNWAGGMMALAAKDPVFWAAFTIANQDVAGVGSTCLRCHTPQAWLEGRSQPPDASGLIDTDYEGITCHFCHRLLDPDYKPGISPLRDLTLTAALTESVTLYGGGMYVVDPDDERRGPWDLKAEGWEVPDCTPEALCDGNNPHRDLGLDWPLESDFHRQSALCGTCHDVLNPMFSGDPVNGYDPDPLGQPIADPATAFPEQRTYTEWLLSDYAKAAGVYAPAFNPTLPDGIVRSCQDCHMPSAADAAAGMIVPHISCDLPSGDPCPDIITHTLVPVHTFSGANLWVPETIKIHPVFSATLETAAIDAAIARNRDFLEKAASLEVVLQGEQLWVRVVNETGHKLPTGYPEGRQMWVSVTAYDDAGQVVYQSGAYDVLSGTLAHDPDLQWFGTEQGLSASWAPTVGLPAGPSFHLALNNQVIFDSRIPPRGFTNAAFAAAGAGPVGATYADGQYWADAMYTVPTETVRVVVGLHYQIASREYIEFLRDENATDSNGDLLYNLWELTDRSPPATLAEVEVRQSLWLPVVGR